MTMTLRSDTDAALIIDLLHEVLTELRAVRADLRRPRRQQKALTRSDREQLARILPVIAATLGPELWTVNELLRDSSPALRIVLAGTTAISLGRLLRRALGVPVDGLIVQSDATEAHRRLWSIAKVI